MVIIIVSVRYVDLVLEIICDVPLPSTVSRINKVFMSATPLLSPPLLLGAPLLLPEGVCVTTVRVPLLLVLPPCSSSRIGARWPSGVGSRVCEYRE